MNRRGFTLIELLATLVVLGIVGALTFSIIQVNTEKTKEHAEEVFIGTLKDALNIYTDSDARNLTYKTASVCTLHKTNGNVGVHKVNDTHVIKFNDVIHSTYSPLLESDVINPNNENVACNLNARVYVYRDDDYVYYYKMAKSALSCLKSSGNITNLPEGCAG